MPLPDNIRVAIIKVAGKWAMESAIHVRDEAERTQNPYVKPFEEEVFQMFDVYYQNLAKYFDSKN
jgi:hypothetical protein